MERDWDDHRKRSGRQLKLDTGSSRDDDHRQLELGTRTEEREGRTEAASRPRHEREAARPAPARESLETGSDTGRGRIEAQPAFRSEGRESGSRSSYERAATGSSSIRTESIPRPADPETATDELRYEGPIRFEDEPLEAPYSEAGSGRTLFTTALIGGAAILIIGIALYLRDEPLGAGIARLDEASEVPVEPGAGAVLGVETPAFEGDAATSLTDADTRGLEDTGLRPLPGASAVADARPAIETPLPAQRSAPAPRPSADVAVARAEPRPAAARSTPPARPEPAPATALAANSPAAAGLAAGLSDLVEAGRLAEAARMARERAQFAPGGSWTLQVLFACQASTVSSAFREDAGSRLMLFPVERPATSCYRLTWGVFPSRDAALAQATHVPAHFRQSERPLPIALERAAGL